MSTKAIAKIRGLDSILTLAEAWLGRVSKHLTRPLRVLCSLGRSVLTTLGVRLRTSQLWPPVLPLKSAQSQYRHFRFHLKILGEFDYDHMARFMSIVLGGRERRLEAGELVGFYGSFQVKGPIMASRTY